MKKIVIRAVDKPKNADPDLLINWFCEVLGLTNEEDKDSIEAELLKKFLTAATNDSGISSSEIKLKEPIARTTVIYHLNRFIESGLVVKEGRKYYLRAQALSPAIEEIEYDIDREMQRMIDTAKEFDKMFAELQKKMKKNYK